MGSINDVCDGPMRTYLADTVPAHMTRVKIFPAIDLNAGE